MIKIKTIEELNLEKSNIEKEIKIFKESNEILYKERKNVSYWKDHPVDKEMNINYSAIKERQNKLEKINLQIKVIEERENGIERLAEDIKFEDINYRMYYEGDYRLDEIESKIETLTKELILAHKTINKLMMHIEILVQN